ncbi:hypothetical protein PORY_001317 [Pneumocystis oryctolagi]|uniref:Uncharacterized protein n=1 Tax=Pneumocystis oryctolagi TaxID=42067 RepID=A0ACB7CBM6_9ASCO|nr:hypothetical protein PORY_001317 [Pneumocystis oryctolagi]
MSKFSRSARKRHKSSKALGTASTASAASTVSAAGLLGPLGPPGPPALPAPALEAPVKRARTGGAARKTFSDFRLAKLQIGNFITEELRAPGDARDARLRFYFRNAADKESAQEMSPVEATLSAPDRLSLSFKKGTLRMVISAEHLFSVVFWRREGRMVIETDGWAVFEEWTSNGSSHPMFKLMNADPTEGELWRVKKIEAWLDRTLPLTEPKWTKGNVRDYIDGLSKFHDILHVLDADPVRFEWFCCPTLQGILEQWTRLSAIGMFLVEGGGGSMIDTYKYAECVYLYTKGLQSERLLFQRSKLCKLDKLLDIFSGLLRPDSVLTAPTNAMLNIIRAMGSTAMTGDVLLEKVKQALFLIPEHLILKSLDTMFKKELDDIVPENGCNDVHIDSTYE